MEAKLQRFSQHFHKSYQTTKLFSCLTFVVYGRYMTGLKLLLLKCNTVEPLLSGPRLSGHLSYPDDKPDAKN